MLLQWLLRIKQDVILRFEEIHLEKSILIISVSRQNSQTMG